MKTFFKTVVCLLFIALVVYAGVSIDIYRWHTFQEVTHSDISYWKWHILMSR